MGADQSKSKTQDDKTAGSTSAGHSTVMLPDGPAVFVPRQHKCHNHYRKTLKARAEQLAIGVDPASMAPSVIATEPEWDSMMTEFLSANPCVLRTIILPEGVSLDDPRLLDAEEVSRNSYVLPLGQMPEFPKGPYESQIAGQLVADSIGPIPGRTTHYQVVPDDLLERSEFLAEVHASGYIEEDSHVIEESLSEILSET